MTSQKSLSSNVYTKDFLRSLVSALLFPAIAFIVLNLFVAVPVIVEIVNPLNRASFTDTVSYFLSYWSAFYDDSEFMSIGMVLCGMLTAVKLFYFVMRKKQVNVYFSLGISRVRMFINRTAAGLTALFASVFLPMLALYITNIVYFGMSAHITQVFLYITLMLFISALGGFAIGAFAVSVSGNIFEAGLTIFTTSMFGTLVSTLFEEMCDAMLKGYVYVSGSNRYFALLNPFTFVMDLGAKAPTDRDWGFNYYTSTYYSPITALMAQLERDVAPDKYKIPEDLVIDRGFIIPLLVALAFSLCFLALAVVLFKKRKAEHANSLGHFKVSSFINAAFVFTAAVFLLTETAYGVRGGGELALIIALMIIVPLLAYFIVQLILTRKIKVTLLSLIPATVLTAVTLLAILTMQTGVFGIYNRTPAKADLKSVAIDIGEHPMFNSDIDVYNGPELESSDQGDIDMVLSVFDRIKKEKYQSDSNYTYVTVVFRYKDDKVKYREFQIYSDDTYEEYLRAVYNSNYFDEYLKDLFLSESDEENFDAGYSDGYYYDDIYYYEYEGYYSEDKYIWRYLDSDSLVDPNSVNWNNNYIEYTKELKMHLYNDLSKMTFEELFKNNSRPLGLITGDYYKTQNADDTITKIVDDYYWYYDDYTDAKGTCVGESELYIYPEMKETIAYLEEMGYDLASEKHTIKEILYTDSDLKLFTATAKYAKAYKEDYSGYGSYSMWYSENDDRTFDRRILNESSLYGMRYVIPEDTNSLVLLKDVYNVSEHPLVSVTDAEKIDSIMNACVPFYLTAGDNGRYAYVIYDDGTMVSYYIPQANLDVLK